MPYVQKTYTGENARRMARYGSTTTLPLRPSPWWPEEICMKIERIVWGVYCLGETEDWHEFTAYDKEGKVLGVHRVNGY